MVCFGMLYDFGGLDGVYSINENSIFMICLDDFYFCIQIDVVELVIEILFGVGIDFLCVYVGLNIDVLFIVNLFGVVNDFLVYIESDCVIIQF